MVYVGLVHIALVCPPLVTWILTLANCIKSYCSTNVRDCDKVGLARGNGNSKARPSIRPSGDKVQRKYGYVNCAKKNFQERSAGFWGVNTVTSIFVENVEVYLQL